MVPAEFRNKTGTGPGGTRQTVVDMADTQFSLAAFMRLPMQLKLLSIIALSMVAAIAVAGWT